MIDTNCSVIANVPFKNYCFSDWIAIGILLIFICSFCFILGYWFADKINKELRGKSE